MEKRLGFSSDLISELPDNILEKILVNLPIKDAVRTSLLSKKWRYRWASLPEIVIIEEYIPLSTQNEAHMFVNFVYRFLLIHTGPIQKFEISMYRSTENSSAIDSWVDFLSRTNLKEMKLKFLGFNHKRYEISSILFSIQSLSSLELCNCFLQVPPTFGGFKNLRTLKLEDIIFPNEEIFENMISKCPILENLSFLDTYENITFTRLNISSSNLQRFHFLGNFNDICFVGSPHLTNVYIYLNDIISDNQFEHPVISHLINVLGCLSGVQKFDIRGYFLQLLAIFDFPRCSQLPVSYNHLIKLSLEVSFKNLNEILLTICLIKSSPNLQKLKIYAATNLDRAMNSGENFWGTQGQVDFSMDHLNMVKFIDISDAQIELEFVKFLLANSPLLEVMHLTPRGPHIDELMMLKELLSIKHASPNVKINYRA